MATRVGTKQIQGRTIACISSSNGSGATIVQLYPMCRSKASFFDRLRQELALPASASMREVVTCLCKKSWNGRAWVDDAK